ncbi:MAG: hypothetical protein ACFFB3_22110 [Candidatus Hodarchaeota archaeon]
MLHIHLYGKFRIKAPDSSASGQSVVLLENQFQTLLDVLKELEIDPTQTGDIFLNGMLAAFDTEIPSDDCRIGIFPLGMHLIDGGQHLKGHGFITKKRTKNPNYW